MTADDFKRQQERARDTISRWPTYKRLNIVRCGASAKGGPCVLPRGHNMGRIDIPENHRAATSPTSDTDLRAALERLVRLLDDTQLAWGDNAELDAAHESARAALEGTTQTGRKQCKHGRFEPHLIEGIPPPWDDCDGKPDSGASSEASDTDLRAALTTLVAAIENPMTPELVTPALTKAHRVLEGAKPHGLIDKLRPRSCRTCREEDAGLPFGAYDREDPSVDYAGTEGDTE